MQVTKKPVEFNKDVKKIFGLISELQYSFTGLINELSELDTLLRYLAKFKNVEISDYIKDIIDSYVSNIIETSESVLSTVNVIKKILRFMVDEGYLRDDLPVYKGMVCMLNDIYTTTSKILDVFKNTSISSKDELDKVLHSIYFEGLAISEYVYQIKFSLMSFIKAYEYDPPENNIEKDLAWEDVFKAGVVALGIIVIGNLLFGR